MSDRQLLELAAKAAGLRHLEWFPTGSGGTMAHVHRDESGRREERWNPLDDDADAFRLAVELRIRFERHSAHPFVAAWAPEVVGRFEEPIGGDPCAAIRRAIVRAAAALGAQA